jgi:hypothetical protein
MATASRSLIGWGKHIWKLKGRRIQDSYTLKLGSITMRKNWEVYSFWVSKEVNTCCRSLTADGLNRWLSPSGLIKTPVEDSSELHNCVREVLATFWLNHTHNAIKSLAWYLLVLWTKPTFLASCWRACGDKDRCNSCEKRVSSPETSWQNVSSKINWISTSRFMSYSTNGCFSLRSELSLRQLFLLSRQVCKRMQVLRFFWNWKN